MNLKSILNKSFITISMLGINMGMLATATPVHADIVQNDASVYTVYKPTHVYKSYKEHAKKRHQVLDANTSWKVIKTAYDKQGRKWYDLGKNQWVKVEKPQTATIITQANTTSTTVNTSSTTVDTSSTQAVSQAPKANYSAAQPVYHTPSVTTHTYSNNASGTTNSSSEASAKAWIASRESGGSYNARNGQYIGKYQLSASYLGGDYSPANQERVADQYVKSRYGSWSAAKAHWQSNGSY